MQLVSIYLLCYIDKYVIEIRHKNEILCIEFSLNMSNVEIETNLNMWYAGKQEVELFALTLEAFGKLLQHYLSLIKPQELELDEYEVRDILKLSNNIYNISLDEWISLVANK